MHRGKAANEIALFDNWSRKSSEGLLRMLISGRPAARLNQSQSRRCFSTKAFSS